MNKNALIGLVRYESLVAQWLEHSTDVQKVVSIAVGDSIFFSLCYVPDMMYVTSFCFIFLFL